VTFLDDQSGRSRTIALLTATANEMRRVTAALPWQSEGNGWTFRFGCTEYIASVTGIGPQAAEQHTRQLLEQRKIDWIIVCGFAGGLDPDWPTGRLMRARWVIDEQGSAALLTDRPPQVTADSDGRSSDDSILTTTSVIATVQRKQALYARYHAAMVDTESFSIARTAAEYGVALTVLRAVSDPADCPLPGGVGDWVDTNGAVRVLAVTRFILTHPWQLHRLLRMKRQAQIAGDNLAAELRIIMGM